MTGSTWRFRSSCLCPVLSRMQGDGLLFHILLLLLDPPTFLHATSGKAVMEVCIKRHKGEQKSRKSQLCFAEVKEELCGV